MSTLLKIPPQIRKPKYYKGDIYYTTQAYIYNKQFKVGFVKGRSENFNILNKTENYCNKYLKLLNSNKLNYKPEYISTDVEFSIHFGICTPFLMYCDTTKDICHFNFDL